MAPPAAPAATPAAPAAAPPALPAQSQSQTLTQSGERRYIGTPVSLDLDGADLRATLRTLVEHGGLNVVFDPSVQGTVDIFVRDIPWDQALETILRANKLGYVAEGTIIRIAPLNVLADEEAERRKLAEARALAGDLSVQTFTLSYARAQDMQPLLTKFGAVIAWPDPGRYAHQHAHHHRPGRPPADRRQPSQLARSGRAAGGSRSAHRPDQPRLRQSDRHPVGPQRTHDPGHRQHHRPRVPEPGHASVDGSAPRVRSGLTPARPRAEQTGTGVNLGVDAASSAIGLALGSVNGAFNLDVALSALERTGQRAASCRRRA